MKDGQQRTTANRHHYRLDMVTQKGRVITDTINVTDMPTSGP